MTSPAGPVARVNLAPELFPITFRIISGSTGETLWTRTVTLEEASSLAKVEFPGFAATPHYPVRVEITYANGYTEIKGMQ